VASVEELEKVESLAAANFTKDDPVGAVAESGFEEIANGYCGKAGLSLAGLESNQVVFPDLDFGGVFDNQDAFGVANAARAEDAAVNVWNLA